MSLQYLKKELSYELDVLHTHKHENLLEVEVDILARHAKINDCKGIRNLNHLVRKQTLNQIIRLNLQYLCDISRKESGMLLGT